MKSACFDKFPFPDPDEATKQRIRELGEQLDAHRKRQQELHPTLTMTGMYNVLEKLRSGEPLNKKEQTIHEQGLVSVLKQIHDDLDAAVAAAYGWPADLEDEAILQRLVDLNQQRAEEERRGHVRWLRPEFQNPAAAAERVGGAEPGKKQQDLAVAGETDDEEQPPAPVPAKKIPWPTEKDRQPHQERVRLLRQALVEAARPLSADEVAVRFSKANRKKVHELLETLVAVGQARVTPDERYAL
ncbi:MAG TPA: hypothetical protein VGN57_01080 [Pirellulaceae bacterium]|nr:hypothetical protein [Pirellulaceae bacterium]